MKTANLRRIFETYYIKGGAMTPFYELHTHSEYSNTHLIDCINKINSLLDHAVHLGLCGLALTDHECLSGHIKALNHAKEIQQGHPDFQLILGNEIYLCQDVSPVTSENGRVSYPIESGQFFHFVLLAKDAQGHRQLRELSSRAWSRCYSYKGVERLPTFYSDLDDVVLPDPGHLIACTACLGGEFAKLTLAGDVQGSLSFVSKCQQWFGEGHFFIELQPGLSQEQRLFNTRAIKFCKHFGLPWIITNDVHYLSADKRILHETFLKSHEEEREAGDFYESTYFKTPQEMIERMQSDIAQEDILAGFQNTAVIADLCKNAGDYGLFHSTIVPKRSLPSLCPNHVLANVDRSLYPFIHQFSTSDEPQDRWLVQQAAKGLSDKRIPLDDTVLSRINYELEQINGVSKRIGQPVSAYYNLTQLIIQIMWDDQGGNSLVGPARGSVGGWYLAYLMDIIQLDPLKWGTVPWRHLHASRPDMPDIDIDTEGFKRASVFNAIRDYFGHDKVLSTITFRTETLKSAILTACRGLGIESDAAGELSSLVPITRGKVWTLDQCLHGNADNGFQPVAEFVSKASQYPHLLDTLKEIEGIVSGRGQHASSVYLFNDPFIEHNSLAKTPKGIDCTCWSMEDSDQCSALKEDFLTIEALDKIRQCMQYLLDDGLIQWKGSLKATYDSFLHPDVLDYNTPEMWAMAADGKITDLFQMDTPTGGEAIKKVRPTNLKEMALTNSVMRLMGNEDFSPIDRFVAFKNNPSLWYEEARACGLTQDEISTLEATLKPNHMCSIEQEDLMRLVMDPHISHFDMVQANKARKGVAKKKANLVAEIRELYNQKGAEIGSRKLFLDYVWKFFIAPQLGYSFSANHTLPYSCIALQEMNLFYHYPHIYWQCACLTVNAQADEEGEDNSSTNYGKIASAIGRMQSQGVCIALPDINQARFGFLPDAQNDRIVFGLKGLVGIGDDIVRQVIAGRPYSSIEDFYAKNSSLPSKALVALVKAGCFDTLENKPRPVIMQRLVSLISAQKCEDKTSLDFKNFSSVCNLPDFIPGKFSFQVHLVRFRASIFKPSALVTNKPKSYRLDRLSSIFFENELLSLFKENEDFYYDQNDSIVIYHAKFEKKYKEVIAPLKDWLTSEQTLSAFNMAQREQFEKSFYQQYCSGSVPKWEMDSLSFYYTEHELANVNTGAYNISGFDSIPETPVLEKTETRTDPKTGNTTNWSRYSLYRIAGTVLDRNNTRHTVSLLTTSGVVTVKLYAGAYTHYNRQISRQEGDTKTIVEKSWFTRGNKLLVTGIRRGDNFFPKKYFDSIYKHAICLIDSVNADGTLVLRTDRYKEE